MFDFENAMKIIVALGTTGFVILMLGIGVKVLFFRRKPIGPAADPEHLEALEERVLRTEAKVGELEERLDFTERMLAESRRRAQLPGS
jgi:hypothetical protein